MIPLIPMLRGFGGGAVQRHFQWGPVKKKTWMSKTETSVVLNIPASLYNDLRQSLFTINEQCQAKVFAPAFCNITTMSGLFSKTQVSG